MNVLEGGVVRMMIASAQLRLNRVRLSRFWCWQSFRGQAGFRGALQFVNVCARKLRHHQYVDLLLGGRMSSTVAAKPNVKTRVYRLRT